MIEDYRTALVVHAANVLGRPFNDPAATDAADYVLWLAGSNRGGHDKVKRCIQRRQEDKRYDDIVGDLVVCVQSGRFKGVSP